MTEIVLTPDWINLAKYMAYTLRNAEFDSIHAKEQFSEEYSKILVYLKTTNPEGYEEVRLFGNTLADNEAGMVQVNTDGW